MIKLIRSDLNSIGTITIRFMKYIRGQTVSHREGSSSTGREGSAGGLLWDDNERWVVVAACLCRSCGRDILIKCVI